MAVTLPGVEGGAVDVSVIVPPVPLDEIKTPAPVQTTTLLIRTGIVLLDGFAAKWKVATATGPSAIALLFVPSIRQVFVAHVTVFWALVAEEPVVTVTLVTSDE